MNGLSRDARALLDAARADEEPTEADRVRVRRSVLMKVGGAAVATTLASSTATSTAAASGAAGAAVAASAGGGFVAKIVVVVGLVSAVGVGGAMSLRAPAPASAPAPAATASTHAAEAFQASPLGSSSTAQAQPESPVAEAPAVPEPPPAARSAAADPVARPTKAGPRAAAAASTPATAGAAAAPARKEPGLDEELALLRDAQGEIAAGRADRALALLDAHEKSFGRGVMTEERRASRVIALCRAGRTAEARAEADRFVRDFPRSPAAARVRDACAAEK